MTPRTRKLLTAAALATAFVAGPAAAHEAAAHEPAAAEATQAQASSEESVTRAARPSVVARAVSGMETVARVIATVDGTACRIGNGKGPMYSDNLYRCIKAGAQGQYVIYVPRSTRGR